MNAPRVISEEAAGGKDGQKDEVVESDLVQWHALHGFRVSRTFEFLQRANLAAMLIIQLKSLAPTHMLMAWITKHTGLSSGSRSTAMVEYVVPDTSPVFKALAAGTQLARDTTSDA